MYSLRQVLIPDKSFIKKLFFIAIPIALQNMSSSILAILDVAIIKGLGETAISSVSLAGQFAFVANLITFGFTSGASVFLSRYFAAEDEDGVKKTFIMTTMLVFLVNSFVAIFAFFTPNTVMKIFTNQPELIDGGSKYLVTAALSYLLHGISSSFFALFRSDRKAHYSMSITIISLSLKTLLNYILICGWGDIPSYGIQGAAMSKGGKSIIAINSTWKDKEGNLRSSIIPFMPPGTIVTTPRTEVDYVITEYGVTNLKYKQVSERIKAMISVAHPDFRDELKFQAKRFWRE